MQGQDANTKVRAPASQDGGSQSILSQTPKTEVYRPAKLASGLSSSTAEERTASPLLPNDSAVTPLPQLGKKVAWHLQPGENLLEPAGDLCRMVR